jgi:hypothetical protein
MLYALNGDVEIEDKERGGVLLAQLTSDVSTADAETVTADDVRLLVSVVADPSSVGEPLKPWSSPSVP